MKNIEFCHHPMEQIIGCPFDKQECKGCVFYHKIELPKTFMIIILEWFLRNIWCYFFNNNKPFAKLYLKSIGFLKLGIGLWILETIFFLFFYGWHWKATQLPEMICDNISLVLILIGLYYLYRCIFKLIYAFIKYDEKDGEK
jgi:uncharacterized protein with PQ loop repeat